MTLSKVKKVLRDYDGRLKMDAHIHWMCQEVQKFRTSKTEKAMRWLGFIQGYLYTTGEFTINELKRHNKQRDRQ